MRILIADDETTTRTMLNHKLNDWGYKVVMVSSGTEAWENLQGEDAPKLTLLDWMMPGMDGLELCRKLRRIESNNPPYIILLTSRDDKADIVKGLDAGADDYMTKPFDQNELRSRITAGRRIIELQQALLEKKKCRDALDMAGKVCHDLNQPMMAVSGYAELLMMDLDENDPLYRQVNTIKEQIDRMGKITQQLMIITRDQFRN